MRRVTAQVGLGLMLGLSPDVLPILTEPECSSRNGSHSLARQSHCLILCRGRSLSWDGSKISPLALEALWGLC